MFNADGSLRTPDPSDEEEAAPAAAASEPKPEPQPEPRPEPKPEPAPAPAPAADEYDAPPERPGEPSMFSDLVVNLASQAAMYMGLVDNPLAPKMPTDVHAARQMIDILGMLQEKTRGNLTQEEALLLERILTDLRMQYVAMATTRR
jgi:hypothetical protein